MDYNFEFSYLYSTVCQSTRLSDSQLSIYQTESCPIQGLASNWIKTDLNCKVWKFIDTLCRDLINFSSNEVWWTYFILFTYIDIQIYIIFIFSSFDAVLYSSPLWSNDVCVILENCTPHWCVSASRLQSSLPALTSICNCFQTFLYWASFTQWELLLSEKYSDNNCS